MATTYVHLNPAELVIHLFGGVRATARAINRQPSSVSKWKKPEPEGCGGIIPAKVRRPILEWAESHGWKLTSHDLDYGRKVRIS